MFSAKNSCSGIIVLEGVHMTYLVPLKIIRKTEVLEASSYKKSTLYTRIKAGLMPPPISLGGARAVGWIEHEVQTVIAAMCAGKSPDEIKQLVTKLIAKRTELV